jgi:3-methyladenine DNA glycosylase Mpg
MSGLRYAPEEIARLGEALFERDVLPRINGQDRNDIVAIDIESGTYVIDSDQLSAAHQLRARNPEAQIWFRRVGSRYVHRMGGIPRVRPEAHD